MSTLIVMVVSGIVFAYFATQNTGVVFINLLGTTYSLPIYVVVLGSLLLGLLISGFISVVESLSSMFEIHNRDVKIDQSEKTVEQLKHKISDMEETNDRLRNHKTNTVYSPTSSQNKARLFFQKLRGQIPS